MAQGIKSLAANFDSLSWIPGTACGRKRELAHASYLLTSHGWHRSTQTS